MTTKSEQAIIDAFASLDKIALGLAVGTFAGLAVFLSTIFLLIKGGNPIGPNLALLGQFFIGYTVTPAGAFIGLIYGFIVGFALGWLSALLRNFLLNAYLQMVKTRSNMASYYESLD
jgi:hypothetical protein